MNELRKQIKKIQPSVKDSLFMYLFENREFKFLTKNKSITGFELDLDNNDVLHGLVFIAFKKQSIIVYKNDTHEDLKLIIFPTEAVLVSDKFDIKNLNVKQCIYSDSSFVGRLVKTGKLGKLTNDILSTKVENFELPDFDRLDKANLENELETSFYNKTIKEPMVTNKVDVTKETLHNETIKNNQEVTNEVNIENLPLDEKLIHLFNKDEFKEPTDVMNYCVVNNGSNKMVLMNLLNYLLAEAKYPTLSKKEAIFYYIKLVNKAFKEGHI